MILWYQGQKVKKSNASKLARGFLNLGPAKTPKSSHFSQKNERIWGVLGLREHEMRSNPWYHRGQNTFWPQHHIMYIVWNQRFHTSWLVCPPKRADGNEYVFLTRFSISYHILMRNKFQSIFPCPLLMRNKFQSIFPWPLTYCCQ